MSLTLLMEQHAMTSLPFGCIDAKLFIVTYKAGYDIFVLPGIRH